MQTIKPMSIAKLDRHIDGYIAALRSTVRRMVNPPVEKSWMTDEQRNAFNIIQIRNLKRRIRILKRVLNP
jgi:hypothetical protein